MTDEPLMSDVIIDHYTGCHDPVDIETILIDAEWWMDTLEDNKDIDAMHDFIQFCYRYMPAMIAEIKRLQKDTT